MKRTLRRWLRSLVAIPHGPQRRPAIVRRAVVALAFILLAAEAAVTIRFSGTVGLLMMVTTASLSAFVFRGIGAPGDAGAAIAGAEDRSLPVDKSGLPNRQQLIDTLARDIARCERYSHSLTLSVVRVSQFEEIKGSWGIGTANLAVDHVVETLKRITRTSDFLCRLDESSFAIVLMQCSGRQAAVYTDRLSLAVSNRPLKATSSVKVPLYVGVDVSALEYDATRYRGPLEFLSVAGGDLAPLARSRTVPLRPQGYGLAGDPRGLRQQLVRDYYPVGGMRDFADAYKEPRSRNRHAG